MTPPDHLYGDRRGVPQRPEDHAVAPVLSRRALGGDADAAAGFFGVFMSVNPVFAALTGLAVLGQSLGPAGWLAVAAIVTANAVSLGAAGRRAAPASA